MNLAKKIIFILLMLLLLVPIIQQKTGLFNQPVLQGAFVAPPMPVIALDSIRDSKYQKQVEDYLNYHFGFRGLLIKVKNSVDYLLWKDIPIEDNVAGKDGYIFSRGSMGRYNGDFYNGKDKNERTVEQINFMKEGLAKHGGKLLVLIAPSKESIIPEEMPDDYHSHFNGYSDYADLVAGYKKYNIPYIDYPLLLKSVKDTSRYPLFTKTGFHWSVYGASLAHDILVKQLATIFNKPLPTYSRLGVEFTDTARDSDNDFEGPMNFLFKLSEMRYVYPKLKMNDTTKNRFRPKVIIIGDSFFWQLKSQKMLMHIFSDDSKFWFYFAKTSFPIGDVAGVPLTDVDVMKELQSADLVILVGSISTMGNFPYGITDYYYEHSNQAGMTECTRGYIKNNIPWMALLNKNAALQKKPVDALIAEEAQKIAAGSKSFNLMAANGKYLCANAARNDIIDADKVKASGWELFSLLQLDENKVAVLSFKNKFLSTELHDQQQITANRIKIGEWEIFTKIDLGNGKVAFKAANGMYLSLDEKSQQVFATAKEIGRNERFQFMEK